MATEEPAWPAGWERRLRPMVTVLPYAVLAALAAFTAVLRRDSLDLVLCAAAAVWNLALFTARPAWRDRPAVVAVFLTGLNLFGLVMVVRDPWFGFYSVALYAYAFQIVGWPRELYFIAAAGVVAGTAQATGLDYASWAGWLGRAAVIVVNVLPFCLIAWLGEVMVRYQTGRERALREAREANARLEAALAENAALQERLVEQARAAGVLDERGRMAREIHDTLAQGLTGIVTQLQAAEHLADDPPAWRRHHAAATALARESLAEARRSVNELRPERLETGRLADAIAEVAATWSDRHGVPVAVTVTGFSRALRPEAEVSLFRTAQEALANVAKHASSATRVGVTLSYMDQQVALDVRDDGPGFDPLSLNGGFGLVAMRQRIEALSGTLQIESEAGGGTGISASLPLEVSP
ncbi:sensor histidine kinase [Actinoplanes sp. NPDC051411]|uniref:sensor histidine kinase n=1 Tax=Actinoplanes sp. NPDC051411 TaxID=3155522 RepID=UPI00341C1876